MADTKVVSNGMSVEFKDPLDASTYTFVNNQANNGASNGGNTSNPGSSSTPTGNGNNQPSTPGTSDGSGATNDGQNGGSGTAGENGDISIAFDIVDQKIAEIDTIYRKINNQYSGIVSCLKKLLPYMNGLSVETTINSAITSCKNRINYNANKSKKIQTGINSDSHIIFETASKNYQELAAKVAEMEKTMAVQEAYNQNIGSAIKENTQNINNTQTGVKDLQSKVDTTTVDVNDLKTKVNDYHNTETPTPQALNVDPSVDVDSNV